MCSRYITDEETKRVSAIDIVDRVRLHEDPDQPGTLTEKFRAHVISSWRLEPTAKEPCRFKIRLDVLNGSTVVETSGERDNELQRGAISRSVFTLDFSSVPTGVFTFRVSFLVDVKDQWETAASIPVEILVQSARGSAVARSRRRPKMQKRSSHDLK